MPKRLIPIDVGSKPHESLSNLIARIAACLTLTTRIAERCPRQPFGVSYVK